MTRNQTAWLSKVKRLKRGLKRKEKLGFDVDWDVFEEISKTPKRISQKKLDQFEKLNVRKLSPIIKERVDFSDLIIQNFMHEVSQFPPNIAGLYTQAIFDLLNKYDKQIVAEALERNARTLREYIDKAFKNYGAGEFVSDMVTIIADIISEIDMNFDRDSFIEDAEAFYDEEGYDIFIE